MIPTLGGLQGLSNVIWGNRDLDRPSDGNTIVLAKGLGDWRHRRRHDISDQLSFLLTTPGVWELVCRLGVLSALPGQFLAKNLLLLGVSIWTAAEA